MARVPRAVPGVTGKLVRRLATHVIPAQMEWTSTNRRTVFAQGPGTKKPTPDPDPRGCRHITALVGARQVCRCTNGIMHIRSCQRPRTPLACRQAGDALRAHPCWASCCLAAERTSMAATSPHRPAAASLSLCNQHMLSPRVCRRPAQQQQCSLDEQHSPRFAMAQRCTHPALSCKRRGSLNHILHTRARYRASVRGQRNGHGDKRGCQTWQSHPTCTSTRAVASRAPPMPPCPPR